MSTPNNPLMSQAIQQFNNPMAQPVPSGGGVIDPTQHPRIAALVNLLANAASSYGWTSMPPEQRLQSQALAQQKAQAMAETAARQQQLGYEGQRVGLEGQRVDIERGRAEQEKSYQTGMLQETHERTGVEKKRAAIDQQRADQERDAKKRELDRQEQQFKAEYGPGGLRSQEIKIQQGQLSVQQGRLSAEQEMNDIISKRDEAEAKYHQDSIRAQGLNTDRQALEDERKARYKVADDSLDKHFWFFDSKESLMQRKNQEHAKIDADVNGRIAQAEKTAGTGAGVRPSSGIQVVDPRGVAHTFPDQASADAFKREAGIK